MAKFQPGVQIRTNDRFRLMFSQSERTAQKQWRGVISRRHDGVSGAWWVDVFDPPLPHAQAIHEKFMEIADD